jgi:hypothetical protein
LSIGSFEEEEEEEEEEEQSARTPLRWNETNQKRQFDVIMVSF